MEEREREGRERLTRTWVDDPVHWSNHFLFHLDIRFTWSVARYRSTLFVPYIILLINIDNIIINIIIITFDVRWLEAGTCKWWKSISRFVQEMGHVATVPAPHGCTRAYKCPPPIPFSCNITSGEEDRHSSPTLCSLRSNMSEQSGIERPRSVVKKVLARQQREGEGAVVRRSIGRLVWCFVFFIDCLILCATCT